MDPPIVMFRDVNDVGGLNESLQGLLLVTPGISMDIRCHV